MTRRYAVDIKIVDLTKDESERGSFDGVAFFQTKEEAEDFADAFFENGQKFATQWHKDHF